MLSDEEKREYEELKSLLYTGTISQYGKRKLIDIIEKQQKEIEELKDIKKELTERVLRLESDKFWDNVVSKNKIKEILGIEEETDSEKILSLLQTIVDENSRLEDIEDRKVQVDYERVFNKGVASVENKIKAKIEEINKEMLNEENSLELFYRKKYCKEVLQSLLKEE